MRTASAGETPAPRAAFGGGSGTRLGTAVALWRVLLPTARLVAVIALTAVLCVPAHAGKPGPYLFMYGLRGFGDAPRIARALGLNTLYLDLPPDAPDAVAEIREEARLAKRAGLVVILGMPTTLTEAYKRSPYNRIYTRTVTEWITATVSGLRDVPNLVGWGTGQDLETCISYTDDDFRAYLQTIYPSIDALNASWGKELPNWSGASMQLIDQIDLGQPFDVGRASVDLADYKRSAYSQIMALWARAIRAADPEPSHWIFTGRIPLYRSLMSVPDGYNVVCPSAPIDGLEKDVRTHNVHAVDMARRGGKFEVIPTIRFALPPSDLYREGALAAWVREAGLHGAIGVGLEDFERLNSLTRFDDVIKRMGEELRDSAKGATFACQPKPSVAFLYEPYAAGVLVGAQPVYGHIVKLIEGEPENPYYAFRTGTAFGITDYIALEDLPLKDLSGYGAVIAPLALRIPDTVGKQLTEYALNGGTLLADIGLGRYEAGTWQRPPASMRKLFGELNLENLKSLAGDLSVGEPNRYFPSLVPGMASRGTFSMSAKGGTVGGKRYAISGWAGQTLLPGGAALVAHFNQSFGKDKRPRFGGIIGIPTGAGLTVFATHRLWAYWVPDDPMYMAFHYDLCARGARGQVLGTGLWGNAVEVAFGDQAAYLLNTTGREISANVAMFATDDRAYTNAFTSFTSTLHDVTGRRAGTVVLTVDLVPRRILECHSVPLAVQPYVGEAHVLMSDYSPQQVVFRIAGNGAAINTTRRDRGEVFTKADPTRVRIALTAGAYPISAGSRHQVTVVPDKGETLAEVLTADEEGRLQFNEEITRATVTIKPAG
jgi:hypothetical protein